MPCTPDPSTSPWARAISIMSTVSSGAADPIYDGFDENIANGNNTSGTWGSQPPNTNTEQPPKQTTPPKAITATPSDSNTTPPPGNTGIPVNCIIWDGVNYNIQLSPHFKLSAFSTLALYPHNIPTTPIFGYTMQQRFCNLQAMSQNVSEAIYDKFGMPRINSGIRNDNSTSTGVSQHVKGEAADYQFTGWDYAKYWDNAQWVKDNIPYDQFIFEHSSTTGLVWYHLSFSQSGGRSISDPNKVMTMYRNQYSPGLHRYG